jgi:hypothetical protein
MDSVTKEMKSIDIEIEEPVDTLEIIQCLQNYGVAPTIIYGKNGPAHPPHLYIYISIAGKGTQFSRHGLILNWTLEEKPKIEYYDFIALIMKILKKKCKIDNPKVISQLSVYDMEYEGATVCNTKYFDIKSALGGLAVYDKLTEGKEFKKIKNNKKNYIPDFINSSAKDYHVDVKNNWWEYLRVRCPLWDKFEEGITEGFGRLEQTILFTGLRYLFPPHDKSIFEDIKQIYNLHEKTWKEAGLTLDMIYNLTNRHNIPPLKIVRTNNNYVDIPTYFQGTPSIIIKKDKCDLEELDEWMNTKFFDSFQNDGITYTVCQTASGKTEKIIHALQDIDLYQNKIVYCGPTHNLLKEFEDRCSVLDGNVYRCPPLTLTNKDIVRLSLGLPKERGDSDRTEFLNNLFDEDRKGLFLITHQLAAILESFPADRIIVDENIEEALISDTKITWPQLMTTLAFIDDVEEQEIILDEINKIKNLPRNAKVDTSFIIDYIQPVIENNLDEYLEATSPITIPAGIFNVGKDNVKMSTCGNLSCLRVLNRSKFIDYSIMNNIPVNLFSATPMTALLRNRFNRDYGIKIIEAPQSTNKGRVLQFRGESGAKGKNFEKMDSLIKYMDSVIPPEVKERAYVISFKGTKEIFENAGYKVAEVNGEQVHLRNNAGLDCLKGEYIIVVGKHDRPDDYYLDVWDDCGDGSPIHRQNATFNFNGVKQTLYVWDKELLRKEQLEYIQYVTEQAAGRARALREEGAIVYLFSNFVCAGVDEIFD